ncbi:hypothetical protein D9O36_14935 [Zobellia amurskyensis]|uniref:Uncharacterized protein n=1 Tax=Zobellia amurskyensis TaxID=248905 RepID=A0A7X3D352_9FLAO|nr:hypothetical protein [Zobellia amurskyensis]
MNGYSRSICSTCRYVTHCIITTNKNAISSCSEYVHFFDKEPIEKMFLIRRKPVSKQIIKNRRTAKVLF